jgi:putative peptidoglycan lipid II flippase
LSVAGKLIAFFKEGVVAYRVGTASELDAFLLAYAFPLFFVNVLTGSLATAFVPVYVRVRASEGEQRAAELARRLSWSLGAVLAVAAVVLSPMSSALIRLTVDFDSSTTRLATTLVYALMPVLVLNGLSGFWAGFLNARGKFAVPAMAPATTPLAVAAALLIGWDDLGIYSIVVGTLIGGVVELLLIAAAARANGLRFSMPSGLRTGTQRVLPEFLAAAGGNVLLGATVLIDQAMSAMLAPGSVAALGYGTRITSGLLGVGTMALATALLPHLSQLVAERRFSELRRLLRRSSALTLAITIPVMVILIRFSEGTIDLLFERGSFTAGDTALVANIQAVFAIQIPFFSLSMIAVRLISALQANRWLMIGSALSLALNVVLNLILSAYLGVTGIALATSIVYAAACAFLWAVAIKKLGTVAAHEGLPNLRVVVDE